MVEVTKAEVGAPWDAPGWQGRVMRWVEAKTKGTSYWPIVGVEDVRKWALSRVLRVRTGGGDIYFKAVPSMFANEAGVTAALARLFPHDVPMPIATDPRRNWMLLPDLGKEDLQEGTSLEEWCQVVRLLARMQVECVGRDDELLEAGVGERRLRGMWKEIDSLCADEAVLSLLDSEDRRKLREAVPLLKELCARLGEYGVPETLTHGDFHGGNIARVDGRHVIFDWTDAAISHPFLDMSILLNWNVPPEQPDEQAQLIDAYLEGWAAYGTREKLREAIRIAFPLSSLYQVMSYRRMIHALGEGAREELIEGLARWVGRALKAL